MAIKHAFQSTLNDDPSAVANGEVTPSNWNDDHTIDGDVNFGNHAAIVGKITAVSSAGLTLEANGGSDVLVLGQGGSANATAYGGWNFDGATANTIATFGGSKTLQSGGAFIDDGVVSSSSAPTGIAFTGTTAPSGAVTYDSSFQQIGKRASGIISIYYATAGSAITALVMNWPSGWPAPLERGGFTAASMPQYIGRGYPITTTATTLSNGSTFCGIRRNAADSAYEIAFAFSSGSYRAFIMQFEWDVA